MNIIPGNPGTHLIGLNESWANQALNILIPPMTTGSGFCLIEAVTPSFWLVNADSTAALIG